MENTQDLRLGCKHHNNGPACDFDKERDINNQLTRVKGDVTGGKNI